MSNPSDSALMARIKELEDALRGIQTLVMTATKDTSFRTALYHYGSDFDKIRVICKEIVG